MLLYTVDYIIGKNEVQIATIRLLPSMFIETDRKVKNKALGITFEWEDRIITNITFKKNLNINVQGKVPVHEGTYFNGSDVIIMIDHDFTERRYIIKYFGYADILSKIGGLSASIRPVLAAIAPLYIVLYLRTLAEIILDKNRAKFNKEISSTY